MSQFSKREQIAIAAMQGLLTATDPEKDIPYSEIALSASCMASALMREMSIKEVQPRVVYPDNGFLPTID